MAILFKNTLPVSNVQQWTTPSGLHGIAGSGIHTNDIIDILGSLGHPAKLVVVDSPGSDTTLRLNVVQRIYRQYNNTDPQVGNGMGSVRSSATFVGEAEIVRPNIVITANTVQTWNASDMVINDIKIITAPSGLLITAS